MHMVYQSYMGSLVIGLLTNILPYLWLIWQYFK